MSSLLPFPRATISRRAAERLAAGHVWVYRSDVMAIEPAETPAGLLPVHDGAGRLLGTALWSPTSEIALRLVARDALTPEAWLPLFRERIQTALARREALLDEGTDSCRLVFSEADELPGLIVDKYAGIVIFQLLAAGLDTPEIRSAVVEELSSGIGGLETLSLIHI